MDDLILVPLGVLLAIKMNPAEVMSECREQARREPAEGKPVSRAAAVVIIGLWQLAAVLVTVLLVRLLHA